MNNDWEVLGLIFCVLCIVVFLCAMAWNYADTHRPRYDDRVPRQHRRITRNAFKSRAGIS